MRRRKSAFAPPLAALSPLVTQALCSRMPVTGFGDVVTTLPIGSIVVAGGMSFKQIFHGDRCPFAAFQVFIICFILGADRLFLAVFQSLLAFSAGPLRMRYECSTSGDALYVTLNHYHRH